jgi:hypothetical protein
MDEISDDNNEGNDETPQKRKLGSVLLLKLRSERAKRVFIYHLVPISIFLFLAIFMFRNIIGVKGVIIQGDFTYPPDLDRFFKFFYPMWDDTTSVGALARLPRLLFYLPFFAIGFAFDMDTTEMLTMIFIFAEFFSAFSMYYTSRYLLKKVYDISELKISIASFIAAMSYMWSFYLIYNSFYPHHRAAYSLIPFFVLSLIIGLENGKLRYFILAGFLWCVACMDMHLTVHLGILSLSIIVFYFFLKAIKPSDKGILKAFLGSFLTHSKYLITLIISFICFSGYWFIPGLLMGGTSRYQSIIFEESSDIFYTRSTMLNMMSNQASHFQDSVIFSTSPELLDSTGMQDLMLIMGLGIFLFGMFALYLKPKNRYVTFFSLFAIIAIFLTAIPQFSNNMYVWFVNKAPMHEWYGWAFKWPIISQFIVLSVSFLLGFSCIEVFIRVDKVKLRNINVKHGITAAIILLLLVSIILPKWPLATGDMNGWFVPAEMPDEFDQVNAWLEEQDGDFKVLWLPKYRSWEVDWYEGNKVVKDIAGLSSSKPTYVFWSPQKQPNGYGIYFFSSTIYQLHDYAVIFENSTENLGKIIAPLGIKYILFHDDNATAYRAREEYRGNIIFNNLRHQVDMELVKQFGFIYVYENTNYQNDKNSLFYPTSKDFLIYGGLSSLKTLSSLPEFNSVNDGLIFAHQKRFDFEDLRSATDGIIFTRSSGLEEIAFTYADDRYFIAPFDHTDYISGHDHWSKVKFNHYGNAPVYRRGNMDEWDRDYDEGIVFTWSPGELIADASLTDVERVINYDFEVGMHGIDSKTSNLTITLSNRSASGEYSLKGLIDREPEKMLQIAQSELIPIVEGSYFYRISLSLAAKDASNVQVKVIYFDEDNNYLGRHFVMTESGSFDFTKYSKDLLIPAETQFFSIQILADQNAIADSYWWLDDIIIYDLKNITTHNRISVDFDVDKSYTYDLFIRSYKSDESGRVNIYVDEKLIESLYTNDIPNTFTWEKIGTEYLPEGTHTISLDNIVGFNAVNLFAVIPQDTMREYIETAENLLEQNELIYLLEAESDFHSQNSIVTEEYGSKASSGQLIRLGSNGEIWQSFQILKAGNYSMALRLGGKGSYYLDMSIEDNTFNLDKNYENDFSWFNLTDIHLNPGNHYLNFSVPGDLTVFKLSYEDGWNETNNTPENWYQPRSQYTAFLDSLNKTDGDFSLGITTDSSGSGWSRMDSHNFTVTTNSYYRASMNIRTKNINDTVVTIHGYNAILGGWEKLGVFVDGLTGTNNWNTYNTNFYLSEDITNITVALNAGQVLNASQGNATVWFDNIILKKDKNMLVNELDFLVLNLNDEGETLSDIFTPGQSPPILDYKKIDGTKYEVKVSSEAPFMLAFAEAYDEFWVARIEGEDGEIESIPLYSMLNGFYITKTGDFTVVIEYKPQQWFNIGATLTGVSIFGSLGYFIWIERKMWGSRLNELYGRMHKLIKN